MSVHFVQVLLTVTESTQILNRFAIFYNETCLPIIGALLKQLNAVEPGYNDICLYDTSSIASDILWYLLIPQR